VDKNRPNEKYFANSKTRVTKLLAWEDVKMFLLVETIIGFSVIMLVLSFLVKSLTSVVKNHVNFYADNLKSEIEHFLRETLDQSFDKIEEIKSKDNKAVLAKIPWRRLGEEYLSLENMKELLKKVTGTEDYENLAARVKKHQANLKYAFDIRMKNLSLACGLGLCLFLNVNAFTIWKTLYTDSNTRAKFASVEYVDNVIAKHDSLEQQIESADDDSLTKEKLEKQRETLEKEIDSFRGDVDFGIGAVWDKNTKDGKPNFPFEFLGSLLTGILVSIGAPYWHDILRTLNSIRGARAGR
jgi:hypothetical protein